VAPGADTPWEASKKRLGFRDTSPTPAAVIPFALVSAIYEYKPLGGPNNTPVRLLVVASRYRGVILDSPKDYGSVEKVVAAKMLVALFQLSQDVPTSLVCGSNMF